MKVSAMNSPNSISETRSTGLRTGSQSFLLRMLSSVTVSHSHPFVSSFFVYLDTF